MSCILPVSVERDGNIRIFYVEFTICTSAWWINIAEPTGRTSWEETNPSSAPGLSLDKDAFYSVPRSPGYWENKKCIYNKGFLQNDSWIFLLPKPEPEALKPTLVVGDLTRDLSPCLMGKKHDFKQMTLTERFLTP